MALYDLAFIYMDFNDFDSLTNKINELKNWDQIEWKNYHDKVNKFIKYKKWSVSTKKLLDFVFN